MNQAPIKIYPAKLLLFGEYTVLHGGSALAIPYTKYGGYWRYLQPREIPAYSLSPFVKHLESLAVRQLDTKSFKKDVANGLIFSSSIPIGYGAGSSGSLCAAVWDRYGQDVEDLMVLQSIFREMESFFHGKSSGLDPLISYLNQPVLQSNSSIQVLDPMPMPIELTVYDSGISRSTSLLVKWYRQEINQNSKFKDQVFDFLLPQNANAIDALISRDSLALKKAFKAISVWQFENFNPLIPERVSVAWRAAQKEEKYFKICGAGGGGFFLNYQPAK